MLSQKSTIHYREMYHIYMDHLGTWLIRFLDAFHVGLVVKFGFVLRFPRCQKAISKRMHDLRMT